MWELAKWNLDWWRAITTYVIIYIYIVTVLLLFSYEAYFDVSEQILFYLKNLEDRGKNLNPDPVAEIAIYITARPPWGFF
jgi:hypothetical protein